MGGRGFRGRGKEPRVRDAYLGSSQCLKEKGSGEEKVVEVVGRSRETSAPRGCTREEIYII